MKEQLINLISILEDPGFTGFNTHNYNQGIESINKKSLGTSLETICCNLFHYTNDGEIRKKDLEHKNMQESELKKLISFLKSGNIESAQKINFLGNSNGL